MIKRLEQSGGGPSRQSRHAAWYCDKAESLDPDRGEPLVGEPSRWFMIERENLRLAMANTLQERPERALVTAVSLRANWMPASTSAVPVRRMINAGRRSMAWFQVRLAVS